ncbi:hypothetical protein E3N88_17828 [Mikania micrantha]|uniref:Uncharacterized protein n=1 Tax=Mikania micrantha TaxID=192012 RepID=A0A5N6NSX9_9ASTR|nr:hypothetical protein E3N88_17828 [Mikania micrantha]
MHDIEPSKTPTPPSSIEQITLDHSQYCFYKLSYTFDTIKEAGDLMAVDQATKAPANGSQNYNNPKVPKFLVSMNFKALLRKNRKDILCHCEWPIYAFKDYQLQMQNTLSKHLKGHMKFNTVTQCFKNSSIDPYRPFTAAINGDRIAVTCYGDCVCFTLVVSVSDWERSTEDVRGILI